MIRTLRFTLVCAVIISVTALAGLSTGIMTLVPAIVLCLFLRDESFLTSSLLLLGIVCGALVVLVNNFFWAQVPLLYLVFGIFFFGLLSYWIAQCMRGRWGYVAFPLGMSISLLVGLFSEIAGAQTSVNAAFLWLTEVPIGTVIFWIILIGIWPAPTARDLEDLVDAVERECATLLRNSADPILNGRDIALYPLTLGPKYFGDLTRLINIQSSKFRREKDKAALLLKLHKLSSIFSDIRYIQRSFVDLPDPGLSTEARKAAAEIVLALSEQIETRSPQDLDDAYRAIGKAEKALSASPSDDDNARRLSGRLAGFSVAAQSLLRSLTTPHDPPASTAPTVPKTKGQVFQLQTDSLKAATKSIIGVLLGIGFILLTDLPASAYLVIAILIILAQPNMGRAHARVRLWFPGAIAGSLWAIMGLLLLSYLPHFGIYLLWFLPGLFISGYLGLGPDRVSYVGVQFVAGMATIMGMAAYPTETILSAEARILGACVGFIIALAVYSFIWPTHPAQLLRLSLANNLRDLAALLKRLTEAGAEPLNAERVADINQRIAALKAQIESDFSLLFDFSFVLSRNVRPPYDYNKIMLGVGWIFGQSWSLRHSPLLSEDKLARDAILKPVTTLEPSLTSILNDVADLLERGEGSQFEDFRTRILAIKAKLRTLHSQAKELPTRTERENAEYGANTMGQFTLRIMEVIDGIDLSKASQAPKTAQLSKMYEAAYQ